MKPKPLEHNALLEGNWSPEHAEALYGLSGWAKGYFDVGADGHLAVLPTCESSRRIDLYELVEGLRARGIRPPILLRFSDLARHRLQALRAAFDAAIDDNDYGGKYAAVYPVKVNQQRLVCSEIRDFAVELGFGLEAGSKPELLAVLALTTGNNEMPIVCNGFKDREFIETVVLATKLGRNIIPVVERFSDVELIVELSQRYGVRPNIGIRIKPAARGTGKWISSAGARSKFGLSVGQVMRAFELLAKHDMADCLKMVHFHIGSQLSDIRRIKSAITELAYFYAELRRLGAGIEIVDVGGGLGVDYDGTASAFDSSVNYTMREYASDIVYRIKTACDDAGVPHPTIFSESGRAMVAYSSVLVFDVLGRFCFDAETDPAEIRARVEREKEDDQPQPLWDLLGTLENLTDRNLIEAYHDALQARDEVNNLFSLGYITLPMRAAAEGLFWLLGKRILERARRLGELPDELSVLADGLSDIYYCNFSVFQSLPDAWAIGQLFPVMPIHRLHQRPTRLATLADITCDSDGKIERFAGDRDIKRTIELHELGDDEPYYLAAFLVGAYQEVLGDLHNLFGDTHVVHVSVDEKSEWSIDEVIEGDSVREVLGYAGFDSAQMTRRLRQDIERATREGRLAVDEGRALREFYERSIAGYTYLE